MGALTLAVTGAAGFLGRRVVALARQRGHDVRAFARGAVPEGWSGDGGIAVHRLDLAGPAADLAGTLAGALAGADAAIHLAASLAGDEAAMRRDGEAATRALLAAMGLAGVPRLVLASSLSVYAAGPPGGAIDEGSALEPRPDRRDAYARAKLAQEAVVREAVVREAGLPQAWVLRIGALFGPGRTWNAHLGPRLGPVLLRLGAGPLPVAWVEHAALACLLAAETRADGVEAVDVVDDDLPDARRFLAALGARAPLAIPLPWRAFDAVAGLAGGLPGMPGLLRRPVLRARMMPRAWPNARLRDRLGWRPVHGFEAAMALSLGEAP